ncbi:two-component regulator propeller domain-containing protein [Maribacter sp. 2308TA10-17]|uniref:ligand-binding sensor domain-containing protein n=1 Tax=Maribacter sp. 2308TA10-17 TaxID=3386276 RepID=UPI0039BC6EC6
MKKQVLIFASLLITVSIVSCNGQQKKAPEKVTAPIPKEAEADTLDFDPYFTESKSITSDYGPNSITRNILQDRNGNIWFATWEGIIKYDGKTFTNFTNKENLRRFHVFSLLEDSKGNIWFGTIGAGVYRYDGTSFTNFTTKNGLANDSIGCFMEDKNGLLWIGTMNGISTYDGTNFSNFTIAGGQLNNDINSIIEDKTGKLWIGARGETSVYDGKIVAKFTKPDGQAFQNVRSIIEDKEGNIWLGGNNGLWSYDGSDFTHYTKNFVGYIYQDSKEQIWTSSAEDGNPQNWELTKYDKLAQGNKGATAQLMLNEQNMFFGIVEDKDRGIWLGTLNGVYRYDGLLFNAFKDNN